MMMNEMRKPTTGTQCPTLFDKRHRIFYIPSRTDKAGHTKAFDYPVIGWGWGWGGVKVLWHEAQSTAHTRVERNSSNFFRPFLYISAKWDGLAPWKICLRMSSIKKFLKKKNKMAHLKIFNCCLLFFHILTFHNLHLENMNYTFP